jgi:hypothetical protein
MPPTRSARLAVIGASISCWLISMALPAMQFHENPGLPSAQTISHSGFEMAFACIFGLLYFNFVLFANPLLLFGWIFLAQQRYRRAAFWLVPAALLALETFQLRGQKFYEDEGGANISYMTHLPRNHRRRDHRLVGQELAHSPRLLLSARSFRR